MQRWNPVLVCSYGGWLADECRRIGVRVIEENFPSSRSLPGRLYGNAAFARRVAAKLGMRPAIVQANDHQEGLLGLELGNRLGARTAIFLRSPTMNRDDYFKYHCDRYDFVSAVGDEFRARAQAWEPGREIALIRDGIYADEILPLKPKPERPPSRVLVIGSPLAWKGWADLTEALHLLERAGVLPPMRFDFTGTRPAPSENDLKLDRLAAANCNFLGRVEAFRDLVRSYDLVINPSRMETFGMAAIEVLAAGVPLLSSRTGVIEQVQEQSDMLFAPGHPAALASALKNVGERWIDMDFGVARAQENIRRSLLIDHAAARLNEGYQRLMPRAG
jgi:glycosyltransferase involved in cell wall biosynthesis